MATAMEDHPMVHDLKVTIQNVSMVRPVEQTQRRSMFLSNIDLILNFPVFTVHFFGAKDGFRPESVTGILEAALGKLLVPYDFMAGRLRVNPQGKRLEIDCNSAGVHLACARSELNLSEIGPLDYPSDAFRQLVPTVASGSMEDQPLCLIQVTAFKCGGLAMGVCTNHAVSDGTAIKLFFQNLAALASGKAMIKAPYTDRTLLSARSLPLIEPDGTSQTPLDRQNPDQELISKTLLEGLKPRVLHLSTDDISRLKDKAKQTNTISPASCTTFNVVTAHIWRCKVLAATAMNPTGDDGSLSNRKWRCFFPVDFRRRLSPQLRPEYVGNAVVSPCAVATTEEVKRRPFSYCVEKILEAANRITDDYVREVIDWREVNKELPRGDVLVSSWLKLGFAEIEYPWGRPRYCCPLMDPTLGMSVLFPSMNDERNGIGSGANLFVCMSDAEFKIFNELLKDI